MVWFGELDMAKSCQDDYKRDTKANTCQFDWTSSPTSEINPNLTHRTNWKDLGKIVGNSKGTYGYATYKTVLVPTHYEEIETEGKDGKKQTFKVPDREKVVQYKPYLLALSNFNLDIPSNAVIYQIKFSVWMRTDKNLHTFAPAGNFRLDGKGNRHDLEDGVTTGWSKGSYVVVPNIELTNKTVRIDYVMDAKTFQQGKYSVSLINKDAFGIDLLMDTGYFNNDKGGEGNIYIERAMCVVEFDIPKPRLKITNPTAEAYKTFNYVVDYDGTESSPYRISGYNDFPLTVNYTNKSLAKNTTNEVRVDIPWGTELVSYSAEVGSYNPSTSVWTFNDKAKANYSLELMLRSGKRGLSNLYAKRIGTKKAFDNYYYYVIGSEYDGYTTMDIVPTGEFHKRHNCCVDIVIRGQSQDNSLTVNVSCDKSLDDEVFTLIDGEDVTLDSQSTTSATLTVPNEYELTLRYCFKPLSTGELTLSVFTTDDPNLTTKKFNVLDPYEYLLDLTGEEHIIRINTHRIASEVETDSHIIPCVSDEVDKEMIMSDCQINMSIWEELDYIGCIPLEHLHFDPKSTFKDKLLNQHYKNKRYMGKELAVDEDITLNVRLHPMQVTTLQGLIEMDKPIPINANHKCFESDALNHRGWAEVYAVTTTKTNEHWYKCDIDVKYLTHNLNTRFKIDKGEKVSDYKVPELMYETHPNGANLSDADGYFITDTDGTFYYASDYVEDGETITFNDAERNSFGIDNGQHIRITSKEPLSQSSIVSFIWSSALIPEEEENAVSRIIRLIEKGSNKTVFEYQYDDLEIGDDEVTGSVIYRRLGSDDTLDDYPIGRDITFRYNPSDITYEDGDFDVETDEDIESEGESGEAHFGSTFILKLNNNVLSFIDEGFNGREIDVDDIQLDDGEYYYQVEWINNNSDAETPTVDCVFDFNVEDTILSTTYSQMFGDLIVSPFPVTDKKIVFTREAEEGTIYYYKNDGEEFSYLIEPYYQYHNGTDLTYNGSSIFDLNYGYDVVYIQNGLVRLGFNRLTGEMYLGKFDVKYDDYITTHHLHLEKFDDANVNMISDDKIEIQVSDSVFTIYRGHPYIKVKHELEDIYIDTVSNRIWGEQVGNSDGVDTPCYWDLMNDKNLLDACVGGGQGLKSSCVTTEKVDVNARQSTSLAWSSFPSPINLDTETTFTLTGTSFSDYVDEISFEDNTCIFGTYSFDVVSDGTPDHFGNIVSTKQIIQTGETAGISADLYDIDGNRVGNNHRVDFYEVFEPVISLTSDTNIIQTGGTANLSATVRDEDGNLIDGVRVDFYEIYSPVITISSTKSIIQSTDTLDLTAKVKDSDGNIIVNEKTYFYVKYNASYNLTASNSIIQTGGTTDLSVTVKDEHNRPVKGEKVYFYVRED